MLLNPKTLTDVGMRHTDSSPKGTRVKLESVMERTMACLIQNRLYVDKRNFLFGSKRSTAVISPLTPA